MGRAFNWKRYGREHDAEEIREELRRTHARERARRDRADSLQRELDDGRAFVKAFTEREPFLVTEIPANIEKAAHIAGRVVDLERALDVALNKTRIARLKEKIAQLEREIRVEAEGGRVLQAGKTEFPSADFLGVRDPDPLPPDSSKRKTPTKVGRILRQPEKLSHDERRRQQPRR